VSQQFYGEVMALSLITPDIASDLEQARQTLRCCSPTRLQRHAETLSRCQFICSAQVRDYVLIESPS